MIAPSTQVVLATVSASSVPPQKDQDKQATLAGQNLVSAIKQLVGAPLSAQKTAQITPPVVGEHAKFDRHGHYRRFVGQRRGCMPDAKASSPKAEHHGKRIRTSASVGSYIGTNLCKKQALAFRLWAKNRRM
jgi:hypothetical protein